MPKLKLGIIGGSGLYDIKEVKNSTWEKIVTPWGDPSDEVFCFELGNKEVCFLPRHGRGHKINPSCINFRANIDALKQKGVTDIVSISAVGSLRKDLPPGIFVLANQFIDRTFARNKTFFDDEIIAHVSMAKPTSDLLTDVCETSLKKLAIDYKRGGIYLAMEGPQFSTKAESLLYKSWGVDVIGMTNMPEAKLAREAEIRYSTIAMVTDYDCWHPDHDSVDVNMIIETLNQNVKNAKELIKSIVYNYEIDDVSDTTKNCLDTAIITDPSCMTDETKNKLKTIAGRVLFK
jgi:5'-methylthioadenosine phosphorylase